MKRYGNLFDTTFSKENLYAAYLDARKGKRKKRATFEFEKNLGANINDLWVRIHNGLYQPDPYFQFKIYEPKERIIHAPSFRDVVVQHAIYRQIYDIFDRTFINTTFACRKGYGTHRASQYAQNALRIYDPNLYTLKMDIRRFFYSIDRDILKQLIEKRIKDADLIAVMMLFAKKEGTIGIPIGNLLSQLYALIYLNPLDHFVKRQLKIKHYVRYVDDFVLIGLDKAKALDVKQAITKFLREHLHLELSRYTIQKIKKGINFVGYRTWQSKAFIRKFSLYKFFRVAREAKVNSMISIAGHAKRTASLPYMMHRLRHEFPELLNQLPNYCRLAALKA